MDRAISFDISRLFLGPMSSSPRGIDRVDLALARHIFRDPMSLNVGVLPTPWGIRTFSAERVRRGLAYLQDVWSEFVDPEQDERWRALRLRLLRPEDGSVEATPGKSSEWSTKFARMRRHLAKTGFSLGKSARATLPQGAIYLNVGQIALAVPPLFRWLDYRRDVTAIFMLHDVIPLDYPHLVEPASVAHHARMVRTAARHADGLVTTTRHAKETITRALGTHERRRLSTLALELPLADAFTRGGHTHPDILDCAYFVVCATVEPRKNLGLLLDVWRDLCAQFGRDAPHLVIVGALGWEADRILAPIRETAMMGMRVHQVSGLSSPALVQLMLGAAAILSPSLAEGFGLPVLEANALGIPTIASDIAAHREIADPLTLLLPADAPDQWKAAVNDRRDGARRSASPAECYNEENTYCRAIIEFCLKCADGKAYAAKASNTKTHP